MSARRMSLELLAADGRRFHCRTDPQQPAPVRGRFGRIFQVRISAAESAQGAQVEQPAAVYCADTAGRKLLNCCSILAELKHDHIVRLIAATRDSESATSVCVLLEWVGSGSLRDIIDRSGCLAESSIASYGRQIGSALQYLHGQSPVVIHCNVKCRSVLLTESGCAKLSGFTSCCRIGGSALSSGAECELGTAIDVRQFGSFLIEMATGRAGCREAPASATPCLARLCEACAGRQPPEIAHLLRDAFFRIPKPIPEQKPSRACSPVQADRCRLKFGHATVGASAPESLLPRRRLGQSDATEELDDEEDDVGAHCLDFYRMINDEEDEGNNDLREDIENFEEEAEEDKDERVDEGSEVFRIDRDGLLGRGRFGSVFRAELYGIPTAAYKTTPGCPEETLNEFRTSSLLLGQLRHDCIVKLIKVLRDSSDIVTVFTELVEGQSLRSILTKRKTGFIEEDIRSYCRQIASGLMYLHEQRPAIVHRNLKCKSVLLRLNGCIKLAGFSLCMRQQRKARPREWGSPCYLAPEILLSAGAEFTVKSDLWAFGCLVFELATGRPPNAEQSRDFDCLHASICAGSMPSLPADSSADLCELYRLCTQHRRERRPGAQRLLALPFFQSTRPLLERRCSSCRRRKPSLLRQRANSDSQVEEKLELRESQQRQQSLLQLPQQQQPLFRLPLLTPRLQQFKQPQQNEQDFEGIHSLKEAALKGSCSKLARIGSEGQPSMQRSHTATQLQQSEPLFETINSFPSSTVYSNVGRPHGYCLLINVEQFGNSKEFPVRNGSLADVGRVSRLFQRLGYRVRSVADPTAAEICKAAMRIALKDHSKYDSFVCFLMSHGTNNQVVGSDGQYISLGRIASFFDSDVCAGLAGKPKLFFIQACRGERQQRNFAITRTRAIGASADQVASAAAGDDDSSAEEPDTGGVLFAPKGADFFFGYATSEKYIAYRDPQTGSAYIRTLCRVVEAHGAAEDLLQLHTRVTAHISSNPQENQFGSKLFQVPDMRSKLTKQFYFPGLSREEKQ